MGSLQQPVWVKESTFLPKGPGVGGFMRQANVGSLKPYRSFKVESSLATGRPTSTSSVPVTVGGN